MPKKFLEAGKIVGTHGVRGINLAEGDEVIALLRLKPGTKVLTITEKGSGKRTEPGLYRITRRGGKGVRNLNITDKTGCAVFVECVADDYDLIITSRGGQIIRIPADSIRVTGRSSQGVRAFDLRDDDVVQDATALPSAEDIAQDSAEAKQNADAIPGASATDAAPSDDVGSKPDGEVPADGDRPEA